MLDSKIQNAMHPYGVTMPSRRKNSAKYEKLEFFFLLGLVTLIIIIDMQVIPGGFLHSFFFFANYVALLYKSINVQSKFLTTIYVDIITELITELVTKTTFKSPFHDMYQHTK